MDAKLKAQVRVWLAKRENQCFKLDGDAVVCRKCSIPVKIKDRRGSSRLSDHLKTPKHQRADSSSKSQTGIVTSLLTSGKENVSEFNHDLFLLFASSNIPLHKLSSPRMKNFFLKYTHKHVECAKFPEKYIIFGYQKIGEQISRRLNSVSFAIYIDETQDTRKRKVVNTVVLPPTWKAETPLLFDTAFVESANKATSSSIVNRVAMSISYDPSLFRSLVTDQCRTNIAAGKELRIFYPNFLHVTCLAHALHLLSETIRDEFPKVNSLVSNMKSVLTYSKARSDLYQSILGDKPLPPKPVITRWGTFLSTAFHHHENFETIKLFVSKIQAKAADSSSLKSLVDDPDLAVQLELIAQFSELPRAITKLECRSISMETQIGILSSIQRSLKGLFATRLEEIMGKNPDIDKLRTMSDRDSEVFKHAILSNSEVERSFSMYENILSHRRHSLSQSSLERLLSIQFNADLLFDE